MPLITGRLLFAKPADKPLANVTVQLHRQPGLPTLNQQQCKGGDVGSLLLRPEALGTAVTNADGGFELTYTGSGQADLHLSFVPRQVHYGRWGVPREHFYLNASKTLLLKAFRTDRNGCADLDPISMPCWERDGRAVTPRLHADPPAELLTNFAGARLLEEVEAPGFLAEAVKGGLGTVVDLAAVSKVGQSMGLLDSIERQLVFGAEKLADILGKHAETFETPSEDDDFHVYLALQGFNPRLLKGDGEVFWMDFSYEGLEIDGVHLACDSTAFFQRKAEKDCDGAMRTSLSLTRIDLQTRTKSKADGSVSVGEVRTYTPFSASEMWRAAKRIWRCNYFYFGEVWTHLTETHFNIEQYILAVMRNVHQNPVYDLLTPHFRGTVTINHLTDKLLLSDTGLLVHGTALTEKSVYDAVRQHYGTLNWQGWEPRQAVCDGHNWALQQSMYWEVLDKYVTYFLTEHAAAIEEHWGEIYDMSSDLVSSSVPYVDQSAEPWQDSREVNKPSSEHPRGPDGKEVAVSPVTKDKRLAPNNRVQNMENLKQFCKYVILYATLRHKHINDAQFVLGQNPEFSSLGLNYDITEEEDAHGKAVSDEDALDLRKTTFALTHVHYGYLTEDEEKNVHPKFREFLEDERTAFESLGLNIDNIRSCINI